MSRLAHIAHSKPRGKSAGGGDACKKLTHDMHLMLRTVVDNLKAAREGAAVPSQAIIPIETYSRHSLY